jgi:oligosaccharide repeat unit polymerase
LSYIIFLLFTLYSYVELGIPLINELNDKSRLDTYTGSGLGYISRILPIFYNYSVFYLFNKLDSSKGKANKIKTIIYLIPFIIAGVLSGSRSSFLSIVFIFWGYKFMYKNSEPQLSNYKWLFVLFVVISLFAFSFQSNSNIFYASYLFLERVISSGDIYWDSLPDDNWRNVVVLEPFKYTFMGFFGPLRLINTASAETPIGYQLTEIIFPTYLDKSTGPVALFPIYGLVCFGYFGGIIFSIIQSIFASLLLKFTFIKSKSIIISSAFFYLFNAFLFFLGDMSAALGILLNGILSIIIFFTIVFTLIGLNKVQFFKIINETK